MKFPLSVPGAGDMPPLDRASWEALVRAARHWQRSQGAASAPEYTAQTSIPQTLVQVRNDTAGDLDAFSVLKLGEPLVSAVDDPHQVRVTPTFPGTAPTDYTDPFAVLIEPAAVGGIARAAILGVVPVDVIVNDATDKWAKPGAAGGAAKLESDPDGGPAKIIWKGTAAGSPLTARALVLLQGDMGTTASAPVSAWKDPTRAATTTDGTLATAFANGSVIDDVTLATGDRILLKNQTSAPANGIYTVNSSGAPTRATDADSGAELLGAAVVVSEGTANADTVWLCTADAPIVVETTALPWIKVGPGGLESLGCHLERDVDDAIAVTPATLAGTAADTGLVTAAGAEVCETLSVDPDVASTYEVDLVEGVTPSVIEEYEDEPIAAIRFVVAKRHHYFRMNAFGVVVLAEGDVDPINTTTLVTFIDSDSVLFNADAMAGTIEAVVNRQMSIVTHANGIKLDGDADDPGNSKYYGTDAGGDKGWYDLPAGTVYSVAATAPAAGFTITGSPITGTGTFAFTLADDLEGVEGLATNGIAVRTTTNTWATRTLTAPAAGFTITDPSGTGGDPAFALADDLAALEALSSTGIAVRTAADSWALRTLTAPTAGFTITDPSGTGGDPAFALADDLAALEALTGTDDIYYRSAASTWTAVTVGTSLDFAGGTLAVTGLVIGTDVQAWDADLDAVAAGTYPGAASITTLGTVVTGAWNGSLIDAAYGGTGASGAAGARTNLGVAIGSDVQAWDADLDALAALAGTNDIYYRSGAATWTAVAVGTGLTFAAGTLTLGNVTPDSVAAVGTVTGSNLSGTNTGNQTITLTGDVTGSGVGSFAATLATAQPDAHTWAAAQTLTVAPVFTDAPGSRTALGATTVGANFFTLTNPSAITFPRVNANNTVDALDAPAFRAAIGAGTGGGDALTTNPLSQFAATTSAQLRDVLSDETGTGLAYFQGGDLGTPSAGVLTNATGTASGLTAGTATALATSRTINGTSFDGSANITVTAAASTLTGATLASGVTASYLTSFGASIALGTPASVVLTNATGLPVAGGGSGRAVTVAYAVICGGTTTTAAQQSVASVGTSGQILTSAGAGALPTFSDPVTGTTAEAVATATQTLGAVANTLEDVTGLTLTLPAAGTYDVFASLLGNVVNSSGGYPQIYASLDLNGSAVANSGFLAVSGNGGTGEAVGTGSIRMLVVAAGAHILKVRAKWLIAGGGTITTKNLAANANGPIRLNYVRIK